jgi:hypothetical protein
MTNFINAVANNLVHLASDACNFAVDAVANVSKGVETYIHLSGDAYSVRLGSRGNAEQVFKQGSATPPGAMQRATCEIEAKSLPVTEASGRYELSARKNDVEIVGKYAEIKPGDGNVAASDLKQMLGTQSVVENGCAVSYGFYDAPDGGKDRAYMYVTDDQSDWMSRCLARKPALRGQPFGTFVLPGSHDAGMFCGLDSDEAGRELVGRLIEKYPSEQMLGQALAGLALGPLLASALTGIVKSGGAATRALINLSYTQKDNISTQLALGVRYFDFRPGYNAPFNGLDNILRHQHNFVPGYEFAKFLADVVDFLKSHGEEIVVVNINSAGFMDPGAMQPKAGEVGAHVLRALERTGLRSGDVSDLGRPVGDLIKDGKRLIVLDQTVSGNTLKVRDSYDDDAYATADPAPILAQLDKTLGGEALDIAWTVLQLQGTYTNLPIRLAKKDLPGKVLAGAMFASWLCSHSDASSPLLSTKASFDHATYPWLMEKNLAGRNLAGRCGKKLVVLLNDFVDNALTSHAAVLTEQRSEGIASTTP